MSQPQNACSPSVPLAPADNDHLLRGIKIAAPCSVNWEAMPGGERVRSCAQCSHKVYNLSAMSSDEAAALIREAEGRICVRLYRRADGSVMTRDCPTGLRAVRQRVARTVAVAFSFASMFSLVGLFSLAERFRARPAATTMGAVMVTPPKNAPMQLPIMGKIAASSIALPAPVRDPGYVMGAPMVAPTPDADKTFLPHESEPSEVRNDPFAALTKESAVTKSGNPAHP